MTADQPRRSLSPSARRMRDLRQRQSQKYRYMGISVHEKAVDALIARGRLDPTYRDDRDTVQCAIELFIYDELVGAE